MRMALIFTDLEEYRNKPRFLYGESMGGAIVLHIHRKEPEEWSGAVLQAPMCKISEKLKPPQIVTSILTMMSNYIPTWKIVPSENIIDNAFKDPIKRAEVTNFPTQLRMPQYYLWTETHDHEIRMKFYLVMGLTRSLTPQIRANPFTYQGRPRVKTALEMLRASESLEQRLDEVPCPWKFALNRGIFLANLAGSV